MAIVKSATKDPRCKFFALVLLASVGPVLPNGLATPVVRLTPKRIEMGSFYSGARLRVDGLVSGAAKAVVVIRGAETKDVFNKKARFGFVWANAGKVTISRTPSLFLCFSPEPVHNMLNSDTIRHRLLDEAVIQALMLIEPEQEARTAAVLRSNYLALKKANGLYCILPGSLNMGQPTEGGTPYSAEFLWPKKAPPASYTVTVLECRGGMVTGEASISLEVVKVGFPATLAVLAYDRAPLYGLLAVLMAVAAGFGIDFLAAKLFGKKRRVAH